MSDHLPYGRWWGAYWAWRVASRRYRQKKRAKWLKRGYERERHERARQARALDKWNRRNRAW